AFFVADAAYGAECLGHGHAFTAETRLEAARRVVDARVDHAAVAPRLMQGGTGFFLGDQDARARLSPDDLGRQRGADNAGADDEIVVLHKGSDGWFGGLRRPRAWFP